MLKLQFVLHSTHIICFSFWYASMSGKKMDKRTIHNFQVNFIFIIATIFRKKKATKTEPFSHIILLFIFLFNCSCTLYNVVYVYIYGHQASTHFIESLIHSPLHVCWLSNSDSWISNSWLFSAFYYPLSSDLFIFPPFLLTLFHLIGCANKSCVQLCRLNSTISSMRNFFSLKTTFIHDYVNAANFIKALSFWFSSLTDSKRHRNRERKKEMKTTRRCHLFDSSRK